MRDYDPQRTGKVCSNCGQPHSEEYPLTPLFDPDILERGRRIHDTCPDLLDVIRNQNEGEHGAV